MAVLVTYLRLKYLKFGNNSIPICAITLRYKNVLEYIKDWINNEQNEYFFQRAEWQYLSSLYNSSLILAEKLLIQGHILWMTWGCATEAEILWLHFHNQSAKEWVLPWSFVPRESVIAIARAPEMALREHCSGLLADRSVFAALLHGDITEASQKPELCDCWPRAGLCLALHFSERKVKSSTVTVSVLCHLSPSQTDCYNNTIDLMNNRNSFHTGLEASEVWWFE